LDGVPLIIKDESNVKGFVTHYGTSGGWVNTKPAEKDDPPVARLRALGVVIIGKANMHVRLSKLLINIFPIRD
jgi:Asp-tRNA(Asn)/Glu-tRNA(Gln) amidotransferase A subunit family amidase